MPFLTSALSIDDTDFLVFLVPVSSSYQISKVHGHIWFKPLVSVFQSSKKSMLILSSSVPLVAVLIFGTEKVGFRGLSINQSDATISLRICFSSGASGEENHDWAHPQTALLVLDASRGYPTWSCHLPYDYLEPCLNTLWYDVVSWHRAFRINLGDYSASSASRFTLPGTVGMILELTRSATAASR